MFFWTPRVPPPRAPWVRFADHRRGTAASGPPFDALNLGGGVGDDPAAVEANRTAVARAVDVPRERLLFMDQCHGTDVAQVDGPWEGEPPRVDALVTTRDDLALAALVADCTPVLLADPVAGVVGAVHAGRPGMIAGIVDERSTRCVEPAAPARRSPPSGRRCAGAATRCRRACAPRPPPSSPPSATVSWTGTPAIDVAAGVVDQLVAPASRVTWVPGCTRESPDLYSYRRDGRPAGSPASSGCSRRAARDRRRRRAELAARLDARPRAHRARLRRGRARPRRRRRSSS